MKVERVGCRLAVEIEHAIGVTTLECYARDGVAVLWVEDAQGDAARIEAAPHDLAAALCLTLHEIVGPSIDDVREAAIRADERAKVEVAVVAELRRRAEPYRFESDDASNAAYQDRARYAMEALRYATEAIEHGRHRSEP